MSYKTLPATLILLCLSCKVNTSAKDREKKNQPSPVFAGPELNPYPFINSIPLPAGFKRINSDSNSFAQWLLHVPLKKDKTVHLFNGDIKRNQSAQFAVLDITVGNRDLQQCADAVMRLRAEYLYDKKNFSQISFSDNEKGVYNFDPPYNREHFQSYLNKVFGICGSASLSKQLKQSNLANIKAGDVLIRGGFPGHAVIVVDVAVNDAGEKIFMLAQSYMPAQDIHLLLNPSAKELSPWYEADDEYYIETPEYLFTKNELKQW
ncbi:MAG: DUF4846 domain-containing protein [Ferruginibacter sp.]